MTSPADVFAVERPRLVALAYRMLGTPDDAEDIAQEAWLRWDRADVDTIENPAAWLTTVTTRIAIDRLRSAQHTREVYVGPWLPEPLVDHGDDTVDPAEVSAYADSVTLHFLTVLERLDPVERAVFLLHDVFAVPFREIAATVERTDANVRQIARRARDRIHHDRPHVRAERDHAEALSIAFLGALIDGDVEAFTKLLTDDVVTISDGGAHRRAARYPVVGPGRVARLLINLAARMEPGMTMDPVTVNGELGWYARLHDQPFMLLVPSFVDDRVNEVLLLLNPDKLARYEDARRRVDATRPGPPQG